MMSSVVIIAKQAVIMLLLILVGMLAYRLKIISKEGGKQLSRLVLEIVTPVLVVHSYLAVDFDTQLVVNLLWTFALSIVSYVLVISGSMLFLRDKANRATAIERFSAVYSNCGFMGIPLVRAMLGAEGVLYVTAFLTIFFFFSWTHGVMMLSGKRDFRAVLKVLRSPTILAIGIGLVLYFTQIKLPDILTETMDFIADLNTPVAMIASGVSVAQVNFLAALKNGRLYYVTAVKLLLLPLLTMGLCLCCPFISMEVRMVVLLMMAAPSAAMCTLQCQHLGLNDQYASQIFAFTTVLSMATMPASMMLFARLVLLME